MSAIVAFSAGAKLPAYLQNRSAPSTINDDVISGGLGFPVLSIKGKVFTLVKDGERKVLTRADDPDEVLQSLTLAVVRANTKNRVFYAKAYVEGSDGESTKPDCYSNDGVAPAADARSPQAKKCQICPHAAWESKRNQDGTPAKGTACTVNTRLSVVDPDHVLGAEKVEPYLLRVPAGSRANFAEAIKLASARGIDYNMLAIKVGFDKEAPSPKLTFKPIGLLDDAAYTVVNGLYDDETVKGMVGLGEVRAAHTVPSSMASELDAAIAAKVARDAETKAKVEHAVTKTEEASVEELETMLPDAPKPARRASAPKQAVVVEEAPVKVTQPVVKETSVEVDDLLGGLDALLSHTDD
jgi:hypothetical protein